MAQEVFSKTYEDWVSATAGLCDPNPKEAKAAFDGALAILDKAFMNVDCPRLQVAGNPIQTLEDLLISMRGRPSREALDRLINATALARAYMR